MERFLNYFRRLFAGHLEARLSQVERETHQTSEDMRRTHDKVEALSKKKYEGVAVTAQWATVFIGLVTVLVAVCVFRSGEASRIVSELDIATRKEKAFYKPSIQITADNDMAVFQFHNPGERPFEQFKVAFAVTRVPSRQAPDPSMTTRSVSYLGIIYGMESFPVALPMPKTSDNVFALAVCEGIQSFGGETKTNKAAAVKYRVSGSWHEYRGGGGKPLGEDDRKTVEEFLNGLHKLNGSQPSLPLSDNW